MTSWKSVVPAEHGRETKGRVAQLSRGRLCGLIRARDGQTVFFHGRDLEGLKYNDITVGASVTFELIPDSISGPRATRIRVKGRRRTETPAGNPETDGAALG
jgi:cold shock CspA family protein